MSPLSKSMVGLTQWSDQSVCRSHKAGPTTLKNAMHAARNRLEPSSAKTGRTRGDLSLMFNLFHPGWWNNSVYTQLLIIWMLVTLAYKLGGGNWLKVSVFPLDSETYINVNDFYVQNNFDLYLPNLKRYGHRCRRRARSVTVQRAFKKCFPAVKNQTVSSHRESTSETLNPTVSSLSDDKV